MTTKIIGNVFEKVNWLKIEEKLLGCQKIAPCVSYPDDFSGLIRTYPLLNQFGDPRNAYSYPYDGKAQITDIGVQLIYFSHFP